MLQTGQYVGCYQDSFNQRLFQGDMTKLKTDNSPSVCVQHCLETGFTLAGLQYAAECFCSNSAPAEDKMLQGDKCNMKCPGETDKTCGGYLTMDVYNTGNY